MRIGLSAILFSLYCCVGHAAEPSVFRWQASVEVQAQAPFQKTIPTAVYQTLGTAIDLPRSLLGTPFIVAVRDPDCPVSKRYSSRLREMQMAELPVLYLLTGAQANEKTARKDQQQNRLSGTYIIDSDGSLANWLGVRTSSEVYLFDSNAQLRYRGAIDDQYGVGFSRPEPTKFFLQDAINAVNSGMAVPLPATVSPGCYVNKTATQERDTGVSWQGQIAQLMQSKCQLCHRPGQAGPFPLQTYQQVEQRKSMIRFVLENHIMPPWPTLTNHDRWMNDRILLDEDRQLIIDWIDAGAPRGEATSAREQVDWQTGWQFGVPDIVLTSSRELNIPAGGDIPYEYVSLPTNFEEDRWVQAIEVNTLASQNAHHILLFLLPPESNPQKFIPGIAMKTTLNRREMHELTLRGFFGGYVAGLPGVRYQPGTAKKLPRGWRILMQIHYEPTGEKKTDRPQIGLYFAKQKPDKIIVTRAAANSDLRIPAGASRHSEAGEYQFRKSGRIYGFFPHTHLRGTAFRYVLKGPDDNKITVLDIPRYDPNWQFYYQLKEPIRVAAGSTLIATGWYDNSRANPNNPNADVEVNFGLRTRDEMMIGYFDWVESH